MKPGWVTTPLNTSSKLKQIKKAEQTKPSAKPNEKTHYSPPLITIKQFIVLSLMAN